MSELAAIDWSAPWLSPWRALGEPIARQVVSGQSQPAALNAAAQALWQAPRRPPVRFVAPTELPASVAYEQTVFECQQCPTREGLHDFFNALAWLQFPLTKARLNQLHVAQIAQTGVAPARGPARDALTLLDENAALLHAPDALWQALVAKDWQRVFVDLRGLWPRSRLVLFGHALLEKLVYPRKPITAHVYPAYPAIEDIATLDAWVAADVNADKLASKPFAHLPVLGVPGWWPGNEVAGFYADPEVFRAARAATTAGL